MIEKLISQRYGNDMTEVKQIVEELKEEQTAMIEKLREEQLAMVEQLKEEQPAMINDSAQLKEDSDRKAQRDVLNSLPFPWNEEEGYEEYT